MKDNKVNIPWLYQIMIDRYEKIIDASEDISFHQIVKVGFPNTWKKYYPEYEMKDTNDIQIGPPAYRHLRSFVEEFGHNIDDVQYWQDHIYDPNDSVIVFFDQEKYYLPKEDIMYEKWHYTYLEVLKYAYERYQEESSI